ncbi:MAG: ABC transporter permease [Oscillospiraceae bacterium]|nr:ABC transporter permease [Oscillospiraceae bacterium]
MSSATSTAENKQAVKKQSQLKEIWRRLKKNKIAVIAMFVIIFLVLIAIFAPLIAPYSYETQDVMRPLEGPSRDHILGTDRLGRDVFSRLLYGAGQSLQMGFTAVLGAALLGIIIGSIAGYYGGWLDNLLMRILDIYQGIPMFLLTVTLAAVLGPSLQNAILAIGIALVPGNARFMRACILTVREMEYIEAAKSINCSVRRIIVSHIIPNAIPPMIVSVTMGLGFAVLSGAMLSYIGLGAQPPTAEWGAMISDGRNYLRSEPQLALYPGLCIMVSVLAFNLFGDGLRDALDPRLKT